MKRVVVLLISLALISSFFGCMQGTGEMTYEGVYVKTENGQHILIRGTDDGEEYYLLQKTETCKALDELKTGDKIKITVACLAYEDAEFSDRQVLSWSKVPFGHTDVSQATLERINTLVAQYES